ncbi:hypothetical protein [Bifidobacterium sp. SO4]|uniref:rolling circle replication-associated protein n=1 Tax=Bifidobacterium sp. SO4 TaxID=2809030 RepID=UPI001BDCBE54|nr:hypothetical protein [Bifidobacterium sp. SO4]MBT1171748.1 hypothetical protein [Bifidobacterium sp. SO4]
MSRIKVQANGGTAIALLTRFDDDRDDDEELDEVRKGGGKRDVCAGWTDDVARRNTDFLRAIEIDDLSGTGFTLTLTVRAGVGPVPEPEKFHRMIGNFLKRIDRKFGLLRNHWLIEFTRKGTPHIHMSVWVRNGNEDAFIPFSVSQWIDIVRKAGCNAQAKAQDVKRLYAWRWVQYVAKHGSRGAKHYQRAPQNLPSEGWREKPGRMWGRGGDWPKHSPPIFDLDYDTGDFKGFWIYRRLVRAWFRSQVSRMPEHTEIQRKAKWRAVVAARRCLKCGLDGPSDDQAILNKPVSEFLDDKVLGTYVNNDPWTDGAPAERVWDGLKLGEVLDNSEVGSSREHVKSAQRPISVWGVRSVNLSIIQWIASNQQDIGCNVRQITKTLDERQVLDGVPTVYQPYC